MIELRKVKKDMEQRMAELREYDWETAKRGTGNVQLNINLRSIGINPYDYYSNCGSDHGTKIFFVSPFHGCDA